MLHSIQDCVCPCTHSLSKYALNKGLMGYSAIVCRSTPHAFLCLQHPLVTIIGRTSKRRLATCCFTPTASADAQCRFRHTGRGRCAVVQTAVNSLPKEGLALTPTEPEGRFSTQRAWLWHHSCICCWSNTIWL